MKGRRGGGGGTEGRREGGSLHEGHLSYPTPAVKEPSTNGS